MLPDEIQERLRRTEALAVQSAFALCLAYELMQRAAHAPQKALPGLANLHAHMQRVSATLADILEAGGESGSAPLEAHAGGAGASRLLN
jgi:hypothetical protein